MNDKNKTQTRGVPVDFFAVAKESGMSQGKICRSKWLGWCVQNTTRNPEWPDIAAITPPPMEEGEIFLAIEDGIWCFYKPAKTKATTTSIAGA